VPLYRRCPSHGGPVEGDVGIYSPPQILGCLGHDHRTFQLRDLREHIQFYGETAVDEAEVVLASLRAPELY
jgi:hypothetical protein